jgi:hypothetical protein
VQYNELFLEKNCNDLFCKFIAGNNTAMIMPVAD